MLAQSNTTLKGYGQKSLSHRKSKIPSLLIEWLAHMGNILEVTRVSANIGSADSPRKENENSEKNFYKLQ